MKKTYKNKGFTLVELIVVIAIIMILSAMAVPRIIKYVDEAKEAQIETDFVEIKNAMERALIECKLDGGTLRPGFYDSLGNVIIGANLVGHFKATLPGKMKYVGTFYEENEKENQLTTVGWVFGSLEETFTVTFRLNGVERYMAFYY
ncbi:MAG: type IV pilin protein [Lachnospirales bacterium]